MEFLRSKVVYEGKRVTLEEATYVLKNGNEKTMEHVHVKPAVVILAVSTDEEFIFIRERRTAVGNKNLLGLPAGIIEDGENPKNAALRELEEETGYIANDACLITEFYSSTGYTDERIYIYFTDSIKSISNQELEETEEIEVVKIKIDEAYQMLENGKFDSASVQIALLFHKLLKGGKHYEAK